MKKYTHIAMAGLLSLWMFCGGMGVMFTPVFAQDGEAAAGDTEEPEAKPAPRKKSSKKSSAKKGSTAKKAKDAHDEDDAPKARRTRKAEPEKAPETASEESAEEAPTTVEELADDAPAAEEEPADDAPAAEDAPADEEPVAEPEPAEPTVVSTRRIRKLLEPGTEPGQKVEVTVKKVDYVFCWCPAGKFLMGAPETELGYTPAELQHEVTLTHGFWMLQTEVTQQMWSSIMEKNPSYYAADGFGKDHLLDDAGKPMNTDNFPVDRVRWEDAMQFCEAFSLETGGDFRLPTEAQWEYACRAGTQTRFYTGEKITRKDANFSVGAEGNLERTAEVGSYPPNPWNFLDMMGNVAEWCSDEYDENFYSDPAAANDPCGPLGKEDSWQNKKSERVLRGGYYAVGDYYCRSAARSSRVQNANYGHTFDGFRLVITPAKSPTTLDTDTPDAETPDEIAD